MASDNNRDFTLAKLYEKNPFTVTGLNDKNEIQQSDWIALYNTQEAGSYVGVVFNIRPEDWRHIDILLEDFLKVLNNKDPQNPFFGNLD